MNYRIQHDQKIINFKAEKIGSNIWVHFKGRTFAIPSQPGGQRKRQGAIALKQNGIISPMPGKVTKISVREGSKIKAGEVVLVVEAMKMEFTLKADRDVEIKKILTKAGDNVSMGQTLVEFETK